MIVQRQRDVFLDDVVLLNIGDFRYAIIDKAQYENVAQWRWCLRKSNVCWYICRKSITDGKESRIYLHRFITNAPAGKQVHHRNHNTLDNRLENLFVCSPKEHNQQA
ncbi:hypothetical protein LCGC14_1113830 [marine sediment metagenome]|uniref:HNH nuclease domain-containing protein n=1 Tax=marine sediment metagenome TaxID=412755 RepID=A0A0F9M604_9ZZZZ